MQYATFLLSMWTPHSLKNTDPSWLKLTWHQVHLTGDDFNPFQRYSSRSGINTYNNTAKSLKLSHLLPETSKAPPENQLLEDEISFLGPGLFSGAMFVSWTGSVENYDLLASSWLPISVFVSLGSPRWFGSPGSGDTSCSSWVAGLESHHHPDVFNSPITDPWDERLYLPTWMVDISWEM